MSSKRFIGHLAMSCLSSLEIVILRTSHGIYSSSIAHAARAITVTPRMSVFIASSCFSRFDESAFAEFRRFSGYQASGLSLSCRRLAIAYRAAFSAKAFKAWVVCTLSVSPMRLYFLHIRCYSLTWAVQVYTVARWMPAVSCLMLHERKIVAPRQAMYLCWNVKYI